MQTLTLEQAAKFLHMSAAVLRQKAKVGIVQAAKPGKRWVFLEEDLVLYLRSLYQRNGRVAQSGYGHEVSPCHLGNAATSGGLASQPQMASAYADLLGLKTNSKLRNTTTR